MNGESLPRKSSLVRGSAQLGKLLLRRPSSVGTIDLLGAIASLLYLALFFLSFRFELDVPQEDRPIGWFLAIYACLFVIYLVTARLVWRSGEQRRVTYSIVFYALVFRLATVAATPILEIDIYRYLWDGALVRQGVNPYRVSPKDSKSIDAKAVVSEELRQIAILRDENPALERILNRVHFAELRTIYPPVSQAVFGACDWLTPRNASARTRLVLLKAWLTGFDLATMCLVLLILKELRKNPTWVVAYAWCPLVVKEIAGSGHLDSIAVALMVGAVYLLIRFCRRVAVPVGKLIPGLQQANLAAVVIVFALAVAAKVFPIVLAPVFAGSLAGRIGWWRASLAGLLSIGLIALLFCPMLVTPLTADRTDAHAEEVSAAGAPVVPLAVDQEGASWQLQSADDLSLAEARREANQTSGLVQFAVRWEINDFVFLFVYENIRTDGEDRPWFAVLGEGSRRWLDRKVVARLPLDAKVRSFLFTRIVLSGIVAAMGAWSLVSLARTKEIDELPARILNWSFVLLAVFWTLSPTQNPWYWCWVMPFLAFQRNRGWWLVSGVVACYYTRFWLRSYAGEFSFLGSHLSGADLFHFGVAPLQHMFWQSAVVCFWLWGKWQGARNVQ